MREELKSELLVFEVQRAFNKSKFNKSIVSTRSHSTTAPVLSNYFAKMFSINYTIPRRTDVLTITEDKTTARKNVF